MKSYYTRFKCVHLLHKKLKNLMIVYCPMNSATKGGSVWDETVVKFWEIKETIQKRSLSLVVSP